MPGQHNEPGEPQRLALEPPRRDRAGLARLHQQLGRHLVGRRRRTSRCSPPRRTAMWVCLFDDDGAETRHQLTEHTLGVWHGAIPGVAVGQRYGFRADGAVGPGARPAVQPGQAAARPLRAARSAGDGVRRTPTLLAHDPADPTQSAATRRLARRSCRARWSSTTSSTGAATGRCGTAGATRSIYELHVKGFTAAARPRCPRSCAARTPGSRTPPVDRATCATSASPRSSCCRCTTSSTEPRGRRRGLTQLLGLQLDRLLRPARRRTLRRRPRRAGHRVQADGEALPRRRHRGDPRRRLQPHRRGRARRPDATPSAGSTTSASTSATPTSARRLLGRHRLRQHRRLRATAARCG